MSNKPVSSNCVTIIAEAGVNHNGNIKLAYKLIDMAKRCGADYVKFQTSIPHLHISQQAEKAIYQKRNTGNKQTQLEMSKKLSLAYEEYENLSKYCKKKKINFLSTAFDLKSIDFLKTLKMNFFKIPSGEITNFPYLQKIGKLKKKIVLSTGMSTMKEIGDALKVLIQNGTQKKNITVMHCNTEYPTPIEDVNLKAMISIKKKFNINVGYSDHTMGIDISLWAVAMGAKVIEKHITLNRNLPGPDHKASITEKELKLMITKIKKIEIVLGKEVKKPSKSEKKNINIARNSLVASKSIKKGEKFTYNNITAKRPGTGISPMRIKKIIGKKAKFFFLYDDLIKV